MHARAFRNEEAAICRCNPPHIEMDAGAFAYGRRLICKMIGRARADGGTTICARSVDHLQMHARPFANQRDLDADQKLDRSKWPEVHSIVVTPPFRKWTPQHLQMEECPFDEDGPSISKWRGCAFRNGRATICKWRGLHLQMVGCAFANRARSIYLV